MQHSCHIFGYFASKLCIQMKVCRKNEQVRISGLYLYYTEARGVTGWDRQEQIKLVCQLLRISKCQPATAQEKGGGLLRPPP